MRRARALKLSSPSTTKRKRRNRPALGNAAKEFDFKGFQSAPLISNLAEYVMQRGILADDLRVNAAGSTPKPRPPAVHSGSYDDSARNRPSQYSESIKSS